MRPRSLGPPVAWARSFFGIPAHLVADSQTAFPTSYTIMPKRTYQASKRTRKRQFGFRARMKTAAGRDMDPKAYYAEFLKQPFTQATGQSVINPPANAADFTRFYSENIVQFVLGQKPLDEASWAEFIAGLDSLGAKDLEASAKETLLETGFVK